MLGVGSCWYQTADEYDWTCKEDKDGSFCKLMIQREGNITKTSDKVEYDGVSCCWKVKVADGEWQARCQEDRLEALKRQGCTFRRMSPGVIGVACP